MHCSNCGTLIHSDEVTRQQRVGFSTDNEEGCMVEVQRLVSSCRCDNCGSLTSFEVSLDSLETDVNDRHTDLS
jgi:hypothetical protein